MSEEGKRTCNDRSGLMGALLPDIKAVDKFLDDENCKAETMFLEEPLVLSPITRPVRGQKQRLAGQKYCQRNHR